MKSEIRLRNDMAELPRLVAFASEFAERGELPVEERSRLLVILDELFSNIVRHGYETPAQPGAIEVQLSVSHDRLGIEVADDGKPFDPLAEPAPDLDLPAAERRIGGLGIHFVRNLTDEARYEWENGRNRLILTRRLPSRAG